ncbi:hypothetical protein IFM89_014137 [Coptis chinensis]|uniref:Uncharacterized protein n=1 Tax=Coptis chinensis TaxID=261450 RepID=A0A835HSV9_9MAGN|nr:hypothetical protein IFM89_014137 [Coptis chinensis]
MEETIVTSEKTSTSFPASSATRLICRVCQKQFSNYTCPRCNSRYCSLECYKVSSELNCTTLSEETIQKILSGNQFSLDDLSAEEMKKFQSTIASGELSKLIEPWEPWWLKPSARRISLSSEGTQLVQPVHQKDITMPAQHSMESGHSSDVPAGPETPIPPICKLTSTHPSPLLSVHLVDVVYSYCFTLRLYNGDWHSDALGAAMVLLSLSNVLGEGGQPESVSDVLSYCLEQTCSPAYRHAGGLRFGLGLLEDITCLLNLGGPAVVCLLCDLQRLIQAAEEQLNLEKPRKVKSDITSKFKPATRKVYFLMCWVHEKSGEAWSSLAAIIDLEKKSIDATNQGESRKAMQTTLPNEEAVVFVVSTTGQGDIPDSMKVFWRFLLQKNLSQNWLKGVRYAVFGLGDSAKKLDKRLSDLGGTPIIERSLGDDQHPLGYEGALDPWLSSLWRILNQMSPTVFVRGIADVDSAMEILVHPKFQVIYHEADNLLPNSSSASDLECVWLQIERARFMSPAKFGRDKLRPHCFLQMIKKKLLTRVGCGKDVCHVEFEVLSPGMRYQVGDALEVLPSQDPSAVEAFIQRCNLNPDSYITVLPKRVEIESPGFPSNALRGPVKLRSFVELTMDIASASPRHYFFEARI